MRRTSPQARQRGMAIISALLIAALVAVLAASMLSQQSLFTRQLENQQRRAEGAALLDAGLAWSCQLLAEQRLADPLVRADQRWAQPMLSVPVGGRGGRFDAWLEDEQGKFNLRNLVYEAQVDPRAQDSLRRLFEVLELRPALAEAVMARVIGGYPLLPAPAPDAPAQAGFDSGRDTSSAAKQRLLPARQPMLRDVQQLAQVPGMDAASLQRLAPFLTVLPANTWVNGNTASPEVLAALVPGLSLQKARGLVAERAGGRWFVNRGDFYNRLGMAQLALNDVEVGITSDWFRLHGQTDTLRMQALLRLGESGPAKVFWTRVGA